MKKEIEVNGLTKKQTLEIFKAKESNKSLFEKYKHGKNNNNKTKNRNN